MTTKRAPKKPTAQAELPNEIRVPLSDELREKMRMVADDDGVDLDAWVAALPEYLARSAWTAMQLVNAKGLAGLEREPNRPWASDEARAGLLANLETAVRHWTWVAFAHPHGSVRAKEAQGVARVLAHLLTFEDLAKNAETARFKLKGRDPIRSRSRDLEALCKQVDRYAVAAEGSLERFAESVVDMLLHRDHSPFAQELRELELRKGRDRAVGLVLAALRAKPPVDPDWNDAPGAGARSTLMTAAEALGMPASKARSLFSFQRKRVTRSK